MNYDYNANLSFEERVSIIKNEIIKEYPMIDNDSALKIASIELPIDNDDIENSRYRRLSNILYFYRDNELIKNKVINDMLINYKLIKGKNKKIDNYIENIVIYKEYNTDLPIYE